MCVVRVAWAPVSLLDGTAVVHRLGRVLAAQVGLDEGRENDADHQRRAGEDVGRRVAPLAEQPAVDQREHDAEDLRARVQDAGRGAFGLRVCQLGAEFKAHRQVSRHEESGGWKHSLVKWVHQFSSTVLWLIKLTKILDIIYILFLNLGYFIHYLTVLSQ